MELFLIIIIIILAYFLFKSKKKKGEDFVETANKYGKAFRDAASTFKNSVKENQSVSPINDSSDDKDTASTFKNSANENQPIPPAKDSSDDVDINISEIEELKEIKDEAFSKTSDNISKFLLAQIDESFVFNRITFEKIRQI